MRPQLLARKLPKAGEPEWNVKSRSVRPRFPKGSRDPPIATLSGRDLGRKGHHIFTSLLPLTNEPELDYLTPNSIFSISQITAEAWQNICHRSPTDSRYQITARFARYMRLYALPETDTGPAMPPTPRINSRGGSRVCIRHATRALTGLPPKNDDVIAQFAAYLHLPSSPTVVGSDAESHTRKRKDNVTLGEGTRRKRQKLDSPTEPSSPSPEQPPPRKPVKCSEVRLDLRDIGLFRRSESDEPERGEHTQLPPSSPQSGQNGARNSDLAGETDEDSAGDDDSNDILASDVDSDDDGGSPVNEEVDGLEEDDGDQEGHVDEEDDSDAEEGDEIRHEDIDEDAELGPELLEQLHIAARHKALNKLLSTQIGTSAQVCAGTRVKVQAFVLSLSRTIALISDPFHESRSLALIGLEIAEALRTQNSYGTTRLTIDNFNFLPERITQELTTLRTHIADCAYTIIKEAWPQVLPSDCGTAEERGSAALLASLHLQQLIDNDNFLREGFDPYYPAITTGTPFGCRVLVLVMKAAAYRHAGLGSSATARPDYFSPSPISFIALIAAIIASMLVGLRDGLSIQTIVRRERLGLLYERYKARLEMLEREEKGVANDLRTRISDQCHTLLT
ncbi:hypothetical protein CALCODRAFT_532957 [Calocera cornea HHB12733]|uniref:DUF6532 domain-containing protein n=1 Tax=Calocera cornea HHB12733 TaxID=1353952 RepID=A0A165CXN3_9BASI|nr:hypothetical protein CALCODRAFT_532957 [Calocera cornea HHB12733]